MVYRVADRARHFTLADIPPHPGGAELRTLLAEESSIYSKDVIYCRGVQGPDRKNHGDQEPDWIVRADQIESRTGPDLKDWTGFNQKTDWILRTGPGL